MKKSAHKNTTLNIRLFSGIKIVGILFVVSLLCSPQNVFAQLTELEVTPAEAQGGIPVFRDYPDDAAIIINSSLTGLRFDSNVGLVEDLSRPNEGYYVLIIRPWRQIITVNMQGYRQARFTIPATEAREVLYYDIEPADNQGDLLPVNITVTHSDGSNSKANMSLFIDDQLVESENTTYQLSPGVHQVRIEEPGYRTITDEIEVSINNTLFQYNLMEQQLELVTITTTPDDATVFIDNSSKGITTYEDFIFPGEYFLRLIKSDYKTIETQIVVEEDKRNEFHFDMEKYTGQVQLSVIPSNARIFINRQEYTGQSDISLSPGRYRLEVESDGYEKYTEQFELGENQQFSREITLNAKTGDLQFALQPSEANVSLYNQDNQLVQRWTGSELVRDLPVGTYSFRANHQDYQPLTDQFEIRENERTTVRYIMTETSELERQALAQQEEAERERQRLAQEQARERAQQAEQERIRQEQAAARERRRSLTRYPSFGGANLYISDFAIQSSAFESNVEEKFSIGIGFFNYSNYKTTSFDLVYNSFVMTENTYDNYELAEIQGFSFNASLMPTLPLGPILLGAGGGLDYTQYLDIDYISEFYTVSTFYKFGITFKPRSWDLGLMLDMRGSMDLGIFEDYYPWTQTNFTLVWAYN